GMAVLVPAVAGNIHLFGLRTFGRRLQERLCIGEQGRLVLLESEDIRPAAIENAARHLGMAMQRIGSDDAVLERKQLQHFQGGSDFVAVGGQPLRNRKPRVDRPHVDELQRRAAPPSLEGATQGLAVDCHDPSQLLGKACHEAAEGGFEGLRIEQPEYPAERVVARNTVLQSQELAQQRFLGVAKILHVGATLRPAQNRSQRNNQNLQQIVPCVGCPRVPQASKSFPEFPHEAPPRNRESSSESILRANAIPHSNPYAIPLPLWGRDRERGGDRAPSAKQARSKTQERYLAASVRP